MRFVRAVSVIAILTAPGLSMAAPVETCAPGPETDAAIRATLDEFGSAYVRRDFATLEKVFGEEFTASRPSRENLLTRADYLDTLRADTTTNISITRADEKIRLYGCTAVVTHRTTRLDTGGPHVYRITDVLNSRGGRWQMVNRHVSETPRPASPAPSARP